MPSQFNRQTSAAVTNNLENNQQYSISSPGRDSHEERMVYQNFKNSLLHNQASPPKQRHQQQQPPKGGPPLPLNQIKQQFGGAPTPGILSQVPPPHPPAGPPHLQGNYDHHHYHNNSGVGFDFSQVPPLSTQPLHLQSTDRTGGGGGYHHHPYNDNGALHPPFYQGAPPPYIPFQPMQLPDDLFLNDVYPQTPLQYDQPPQQQRLSQRQRGSKPDALDFAFFDSSNYEDDEDEDYSIHEDMQKNFKRYKNDDLWQQKNRIIVPKAEVSRLLEDQRKAVDETTHPAVLNSSSNFFNQGPFNNPPGCGPQPSGMIGAQGNNGSSLMTRKRQLPPQNLEPYRQSQYQFQSGMQQSYKRWKPSPPLQNTTTNMSTQPNMSGESNAISRFEHQPPVANNSNNNQLIDSLFNKEDQYRPAPPNLQNNYYYNFNNNFCGNNGTNTDQNPSTHKIPYDKQQQQMKQVKSIEIQVTPEKLKESKDVANNNLGACGGVGTTGMMSDNEEEKNQNGGDHKKRRRKRKAQMISEGGKIEDPLKGAFGPPQWMPQGAPGYPPPPLPPSMAGVNYYAYPQMQSGFYMNQNQRYPPNGYYPGSNGMQPYHNPYFMPPPPPPSAPTSKGGKFLPGGHMYPPAPTPGLIQYRAPVVDESTKNQDNLRDYLRTMYFPFQNEQLKELVQQIEIYIQMLYQTLLFSKKKSGNPIEQQQSKPITKRNRSLMAAANKDQNKYKAYCLLYEFQKKKEQTLKPLNLPLYKVPLDTIKPEPHQYQSKKKQLSTQEEPIVLQINPQVSFFQSPLLELAPEVIKQLSKLGSTQSLLQSERESNKSTAKFLKRFLPLINPYLLPITRQSQQIQGEKSAYGKFKNKYIRNDETLNEEGSHNEEEEKRPQQEEDYDYDDDIDKVQQLHQLANSTNNNRRKFSLVDDNFLLLGLRQYGYKEVDLIRTNWLPNKTSNEIKHRYKNLTCAKASDNLIKRWKNTHNIPLSDYEERQLARAVKWFGPTNTNRWPLISKCFLPNRSPHFLKQEYQIIVQDHARAERFGRIMLQESTDGKMSLGANGNPEDQEVFEDIDLDNLSQQQHSKLDDDDDEAAALEELLKLQGELGEEPDQSIDEDEQSKDTRMVDEKQQLYREEDSKKEDLDESESRYYEEVEL